MFEPIVLVHGGAGSVPDSRVEGKLIGVRLAAQEGYKTLLRSGSALDAVEKAVLLMEDDVNFNAGKGSILNLNGEVEMDASVMVGANLTAGAVGNVKNIAHPITLARLVMERTPHVLLCGAGAHKFAREQGVSFVPDGSLITEDAKNALRRFKEMHIAAEPEIGQEDGKEPQKNNEETIPGTVGAVAIDRHGNIAVATSTGGINGKMVGRVGDTAIIGAGTYADNKIAGVSTTGNGDAIIKWSLAHAIVRSIESGLSAQDATEYCIKNMTERLNKTAGAITISKDGGIGIHFSTKRMSWAYFKQNELHYGINQDQHIIEIISN